MSEPLILLTGSTGFIGRAVMAELEARGLSFEAPLGSELDLADAAAVAERFKPESFTVVLHFASRGVRSRADEPSLPRHEAAMARNLLPLVRAGGTFFYAGSMAQYGRAGVLSENMICQPQNAYARAKHETENWLRKAARESGGRSVVARIFGAYGAGEGERRLFPAVIAALRAGRPVDLSDGLQVRDFVHVCDVARISVDLALGERAPCCINIGTGIGLTVRAVVSRLAAELGADPALLRFGARARSPHDQEEMVADTCKLLSAMGNVPPQRLAGSGGLLDLMTKATCGA